MVSVRTRRGVIGVQLIEMLTGIRSRARALVLFSGARLFVRLVRQARPRGLKM